MGWRGRSRDRRCIWGCRTELGYVSGYEFASFVLCEMEGGLVRSGGAAEWLHCGARD